MAKKTKTPEAATTANTTGATTPATAAADVSRGGDDIFAPVFDAGKPKEPTGKLAPQAKVILNTVIAAGKPGIKRSDLIAKLPAAGLVTKQSAGRIVTYYQKELVASGAMTITKPAAPAAHAAPAAA